ncbi:hypothetical protein GCM10022221_67780 [Actinocorallia aurea]
MHRKLPNTRAAAIGNAILAALKWISRTLWEFLAILAFVLIGCSWITVLDLFWGFDPTSEWTPAIFSGAAILLLLAAAPGALHYFERRENTDRPTTPGDDPDAS